MGHPVPITIFGGKRSNQHEHHSDLYQREQGRSQLFGRKPEIILSEVAVNLHHAEFLKAGTLKRV